jgi:thiol:disulfide interchange protein DsbC
MKNLIAGIAMLMLIAGEVTAAAAERWYSDEQVARGETLYRQNCAVCHGPDAESTPDWKTADADGNYPPPPLNGTAHTWHHDLELLRRTIREGGARLGGRMPGFEGHLNAAEIDSIIAFFQSRWPDDIYQRWSDRSAPSDLPSIGDAAPAPEAEATVTRFLRQLIGDAKIDEFAQSPIDDIWQVRIANRYVYLLEWGRYALTGDLIDLEGGRNLTELSRRLSTVEILSEFEQSDLVVFAANGEQKAVLNVFTDTSCPYCQKLHEEVDKLQDAGITVRYLPYPRGGSRGPGYQNLKSVWCAGDRKQAMTAAKQQRFDDLPPGDCAAASTVDRGYTAGNAIGIGGTPALIKSNGEKIEGYRPFEELIPMVLP